MFRIFILLLFIISFSSSTELKKVSLQLNWKYQFEFAGFIAAKEKGFYKQIGLDLDIIEFNGGLNVIDEVKNEKVTFGIYDTSFLNLYDPKKPIVLLANYFKRPALVLITKQNIVVPTDLIGKKVMFLENELNDSSIGTLLKKHNISVEDLIKVEHDFTGEKFISGEVDAFSAFISNELYHIIETKTPYRILDPQNYGISGGGLNLFTSLNNANKNKKLIIDFLEATKKGWEYALANKEELVNIIYNKYSKVKTKEALLFEANETEKLMMTKVYDIGKVLENIISQDISQLKQEGSLKTDIALDKLIFGNNSTSKSNKKISNKEELYIKTKKEILMCIDPNWMPYEEIDQNGKYTGITSEYIPLISKKIGINIKLVKTKNWNQSLEFIKEKKCDILSLATKTAKRSKYLNFTSPYIAFPVVLATKRDTLFIPNPEKIIAKEKLGVVRDYAMSEVLKNKYPDNKIVEVKSVEEGLSLVESGKLFGFIGALPTIAYALQYNYIGELKIAGKFDLDFELGIAVRNDDKILYEILEDAVQSIEENTIQEILNKYISVKVENAVDYTLLYQILAVVVVIALFGFYRQKRLIEYNKVLKRSIEDFEVILSSVIEGLFVFEDNICIEVNKEGLKILGVKDKKDVIGKHLRELISAESYSIISEKLHLGEGSIPYEIEAVRKNNEFIPILVKGSSAIINGKKVRIAAALDISELKNKDKLLSQQAKMAAMGEMLENIAHQWRQPLSLISTASTSIELRAELGMESKVEDIKSLKEINRAAQHLSQTIEDFRSFFSRDKSIKSFSVTNVLEKDLTLLEGMLKSNDIKVIKQINEDLIIKSYENEFTQALLNIFSNAKDAMKDKKTKKLIFIETKKINNFAYLMIKDSGGGIDEKIIDKIFDPYFTTKHKSQGTGIGLYMTHQIIQKHMFGEIDVRNVEYTYEKETYRGAQFIIKLPI